MTLSLQVTGKSWTTWYLEGYFKTVGKTERERGGGGGGEKYDVFQS